jgi:hypothetical protein
MRKIGRKGAKAKASLRLKDIERREANRRYVRKHLGGLDEAERRRRWAEAKRRQRERLRQAAKRQAEAEL